MSKDQLLAVAKELGIKNAESLDYKELQKEVSLAKAAKKEAEAKAKVEAEAKAKKEAEAEAEAKAKAEAEAKAKESKGKTEKVLSWKDENGLEYTFKANAPEKFRFNGVIKTKEEWLKDDVAMTQLVGGQNSYVQRLKSK